MKNVICSLFFCFALLLSKTCFAESEPLNIFGEWVVFSTIQENNTLCYAMTVPERTNTNYQDRGKPFFLIIKQLGDDNVEINTSVGYIVKDKIGSIEIQINDRKFPLLNFQDKAWSYSIKDDKNILEEFQNSAVFSVYGLSHNDKYSLDVYSLNGFYEAYQEINNLCK